MSFGRPKMLRTAIREYVIQPMAVQMRPTRATAPVHPNRLVLVVVMAMRSSVEMMPSSPTRPGAKLFRRAMKALSASSLPVSQMPATANTT